MFLVELVFSGITFLSGLFLVVLSVLVVACCDGEPSCGTLWKQEVMYSCDKGGHHKLPGDMLPPIGVECRGGIRQVASSYILFTGASEVM